MKKKIRWQTEYETKVGQMIKAWRKRYEIITDRKRKKKLKRNL